MTTSKFVFHATTEDALQAIAAEGLLPNDDRDPTFDGYPISGRLYVSLSEEAANFYARSLRDNFDREAVVLRFDGNGLSLSEDEFGNTNDRFTDAVIPSDGIQVRTESGWSSLSDFVRLAAGTTGP